MKASDSANLAWQSYPISALLGRLVSPDEPHRAGVTIVGIDGRSRSGKSSLAASLAASDAHVAVVHTDDVAWHHSFFDWAPLLISGVLQPLRDDGPPTSFTPPAWLQRGRAGAINIGSGATTVLVEGVGAGRRELAPWLDAVIWVETPPETAMQRTVALDRDPPGFVDDWMREERAHLDRDQPWTRADAVVSGDRHPESPDELYVAFL